jgi:hypothetical protein
LRPVEPEFYRLPIASCRDFLSVLDNLTVVLHGLFAPALTDLLSSFNYDVLFASFGGGGGGCTKSSSHVLGISATGTNHVAVNITPLPRPIHGINVGKTCAIHLSYEAVPLSKALIAPQLHAMKTPIYPRYGASRLSTIKMGRNCGGNSLTGIRSNNHFNAVVIIAARFAASSCLLLSMSSTGGGKYLAR